MRLSWQIPVVFSFLLLGVSPLGGGDDAKSSSQSATNTEQQRKMLEAKAKNDPEWYAQMVRELNAFLAMSPERQEQMRKLDRELHRKDSASHERLLRVLQRYVKWLEHLPEKQRQFIESAPNAQERLRRIKEIREREWIQTLPKTVREEIQHSKSKEEREKLIQKYRQQERKRRQEWQAGEKARPKPAPDSKFPDVSDKVLWEFANTELTAQDRKRLNLTFTDPGARERLKEEYFKKHPEELKKLEQKKKNQPKRGSENK